MSTLAMICRLSTPLLGALLLGCTQAPTPPSALPQPAPRWSHAEASQGQPLQPEWWQAFASPELDHLQRQALDANQDLAAAVARLRQAEASARLAGAPLWPSLDGELQASREARLGGEPDVDGNLHSASLAASYELDLWGRLRADRDAAAERLAASRFDRDALRVSLSAAVASAWLQELGLAERERVAQLNLENAEQVLRTVAARRQVGAATALELAQQSGVVAVQRRDLLVLRQAREDARIALAILLGQRLDQLPASQARLDALQAPQFDAGVPSQWLPQRPDLARAEAQLAAADADVQAARAALLPRLSLRASVGGEGSGARRIFADPLYSLAAALSAPIFDGGRLAAELDLSRAQREELLANYRGALIDAFADVESALNAVAGSQAQEQAQAEVLIQAQRAFELAEHRYRAGAETLLSLLDTQRSLYAAEDAAATLRLQRLQASVSLARALGGGWQSER